MKPKITPGRADLTEMVRKIASKVRKSYIEEKQTELKKKELNENEPKVIHNETMYVRISLVNPIKNVWKAEVIDGCPIEIPAIVAYANDPKLAKRRLYRSYLNQLERKKFGASNADRRHRAATVNFIETNLTSNKYQIPNNLKKKYKKK